MNKENEIVRLLVLLNTEAIVLNCSRFRMPYRISVDELEAIATVLTCCNRYYVNTGAEVICALMKDGEVKKGISNIECFAPSTMTKYKGE